jgi:hypothetical protein
METVIWKYYEAVIGTLPPVKVRNWGTYSRNLKKCGNADTRVVGWMDHIRLEYRNPVLHPQEFMSILRALEKMDEERRKKIKYDAAIAGFAAGFQLRQGNEKDSLSLEAGATDAT